MKLDSRPPPPLLAQTRQVHWVVVVRLKVMYMNVDGLVVNGKGLQCKDQTIVTKLDIVGVLEMKLTRDKI